MTLIVGILCKDGVVLASDSAATFGAGGTATIGQQEVRKIRLLNGNILYSSTGAVGISQIVADRIKKMWDDKELASLRSADEAMDRIGKAIAQTITPYLQSGNVVRSLTGDASTCLCKSLVAVPFGNSAQLFTFDYGGAPERATLELPFVAMGSGQAIADPFLAFLKRLLWSDREPTIAEGKLAAVWTIDHVRRTNPGGVGGGIQLGLLQNNPGKLPTAALVAGGDVDEHLQRVASAEATLVGELRGEVAPAPPPPSPNVNSAVRETPPLVKAIADVP